MNKKQTILLLSGIFFGMWLSAGLTKIMHPVWIWIIGSIGLCICLFYAAVFVGEDQILT